MKKSELINGAVLELRNGEKYILLKDRNFNSYEDVMFSLKGGFESLNNYDKDLRIIHIDRRLDIMKVYQPENPSFIAKALEDDFNNWTWERKEILELTLGEISKKYGQEVKIVEKH